MRLIIEIVVGGLLITLLLTFFQDKNQVQDKLNDSQDRIEALEDQANKLRDSVEVLERSSDSLAYVSDSLTDKIEDKDKQLTYTQNAYRDSIESIQEAKLSELIDSSRIIIKGSKTFVLVSEKYYRQARVSEVELERLQSIVGIYRQKVQLQDRLIEVKNEEIMELMHRVAIHKHQINLKDTIITEKSLQIDGKNGQIRKYKLQRNIAVGGVIGTIILILL